MKKNLLLFLSLILGFTIFTPILSVSVNAKEDSSVNVSNNNNNVISQEKIQKYDKYVGLKNNRYFYINNNVLNTVEKNELKSIILESNKLLITSDISKAQVDTKTKIITFKPRIQTRGEGVNAVYWHWWGAEVWLSRTTLQNICQSNGVVAGGAVSFIPWVGKPASVIVGLVTVWGCSAYHSGAIYNAYWPMGPASARFMKWQ